MVEIGRLILISVVYLVAAIFFVFYADKVGIRPFKRKWCIICERNIIAWSPLWRYHMWMDIHVILRYRTAVENAKRIVLEKRDDD